MQTLLQDLRYGFRMLAKNPGFTAVVVLSLALGIGANTAIFSLIDAVMLKMLPVKNPKQLVLLNWVSKRWPEFIRAYSGGGCPDVPKVTLGCSFSYPAFEQIRSQNKVFSDVFAFTSAGRLNFSVNGQAGLAEGDLVSGTYFAALGLNPILGRPITASDDKRGAKPVVVISFGYWQRRFGSDPSAIGKTAILHRVPFTIIGVAPPEYFGLQPGWPRDFWFPLAAQPQIEPPANQEEKSRFSRGDYWWLKVMGRVKPGVNPEQANADLDVIFRQTLTAGPTPSPKPENLPRMYLTSGSKGLETLREMFSEPLLILMGIVGLVLLIACANVANLLLARAAARQREMAVRLALGAARRRLVRQLLTESVLLALLGGAAGLLVAVWGSHLLIGMMYAGGEQISLNIHLNLRVLVFTALVSMLTGILFGMAPAFQSTHVNLTPALKASAGSLGTVQPTSRLRVGLGKVLVVAQVAISLLLLIGAGLFVRTLVKLETLDIGFDRRNILLFWVHPSESGFQGVRLASFYNQILARVGSLPGVLSATTSNMALVSGSYSMSDLSIKGYAPQPKEEMSAYTLHVGPNFFETMSIPLVLGRTIRAQDAETSSNVAVVNESFARHYFPKQDPIGRRFRWRDGKKGPDIEIVGVVRDAAYADLRKQHEPIVYVPLSLEAADAWGEMVFEVRTAADPKAMIPILRRVVDETDPNIPLFGVKTQSEQIDEILSQEWLFARLSSFFGALALLLACVGLYGVMSYAVLRRTNEIGIRIVLGAEREQVLWMVLRESLLLIAVGIAIGLPIALAATRFISSQLYGLKATDPSTIAAATMVLAAVAAFAGYIPARRATKVDPMVALRYE